MRSMPPVPHPGTPISIPLAVHLLMWPALVAWVLLLGRQCRRGRWPWLRRLGVALVPGCLFIDAAALMAAVRWPSQASNSFILALLWLAVLFSVTAFFALRMPGDDGDDGDDWRSPEEGPEPPWWPDFERQFRDYTRRGPRAPARPPNTPTTGVST